MGPRNVIIFGDSTIGRRFVLKLAGVTVNANDLSPTGIFEFKEHSATISKEEYMLYDTAGLTELHGDKLCYGTLEARQALGNLYHFTHRLAGEKVHLLIYVVSGQPSLKNLKLFYEYLCRHDVPMILITTNPAPVSMPQGFPRVTVLTLNETLPENINAKQVQDAIRQISKRKPESVHPMKRFELTAKESWKLLEKEAGWSLTHCREALETTFVKDAELSTEEAQAKCKEIAEYIKKHYFCNVIVFGDTGAGKSSIIQMLTDECKIDTKASSAGGSTSRSQAYDIDIAEYHCRFHDTVGLDDQTSASMPPEEALRSLYQLILNVDGGVSLLVYVHRGKIKPSQVSNYKLFSHVICDKKVPTVLVVTGLEQEDLATDDWWKLNKSLFAAQEMDIKHHACITSTKGKFNERFKEFNYQIEYDQSKEKLKKLFLGAALVEPWKMKKTATFWKSLIVQVYNIFAAKFEWGPLVANPLLHQKLMDIVGLKDDVAMSVANNMERIFGMRGVGHLKKSNSMLTLGDGTTDLEDAKKVPVDHANKVEYVLPSKWEMSRG